MAELSASFIDRFLAMLRRTTALIKPSLAHYIVSKSFSFSYFDMFLSSLAWRTSCSELKLLFLAVTTALARVKRVNTQSELQKF